MSPIARLQGAIARRGIAGAARAALQTAVELPTFSYGFGRLLNATRRFRFDGRSYRYFVDRYNSTWRSERAVEIPIVWDIVQRSGNARILEVGNVLRHYFSVRHDCVDKYEKAPGVINEDVVAYRAAPYDLIISISTLEHVGWDEEPRDPEKILKAIDNLRSLTAPGGRIVITLPFTHNPHVDAYLKDGRIAFTRSLCLKRVSRHNRWVETSWEEATAARFDTPFRRINAIVVGTMEPGSWAAVSPSENASQDPAPGAG